MAQEVKQTPLTIEIPFEEYKELLIIKGRYEELKSQQTIPWTVKPNGTTITYTNNNKTSVGTYVVVAKISSPNYYQLTKTATLKILGREITGVTFNDQ